MRILQIDNYDHCCFCNHDSTHFSILRVSANDYYSRIFDSFIFIHKSNRLFFPSKGLLCLYDKQNNTWLLVDTEFLFSCSTRREIPYLRAPMYCSLYLRHFQESLSLDYYISITRTFRNPVNSIITLVSLALLGFLSFDCLVSISNTFRIICHWIVAFVSPALQGFSFTGLPRQYLVHFQDSLSLDCCVCISRTFRVSFMRLPRQYLAHLQDSPSFDYYISISCNFRILFHWMITLVP